MKMTDWGMHLTPSGAVHPCNRLLSYLLDPLRLLTPADLDPTREGFLPTPLAWWDCLYFTTNNFSDAFQEEAGRAFGRSLGVEAPWAAFVAYPGAKEPQVLVVHVSGPSPVRFVRVLRSAGNVLFLCPITGEPTRRLFVRAGRIGDWSAQNIR